MLNLDKMGVKSHINEIKVDITIDDGGESGRSLVKNGVIFTKWVAQRIEEAPYLKSLVLLLKLLLANNGLNVPYHGIKEQRAI